ncbi:recombination protein NinG [Klebsiella pneumoniae subsp. pneumoniae]|nr:recombination protein NinG [Klebsiella pneumoniae subsp. pneumoniae]
MKPSLRPATCKGLWPALCYSPQQGAETKKSGGGTEGQAEDAQKRRCLPVATTSKKAQSAFNAFIRERDEGKPCPSCGTYHPPMIFGGQWDCGHFMGVGARPELRFEEKNAYRQCKACNGGSGRFAAKNATVHARYRETLIEWYGLPLVEWLEGPHEAKHYSKEDLENIAAKYRRKTRELKKQRAA